VIVRGYSKLIVSHLLSSLMCSTLFFIVVELFCCDYRRDNDNQHNSCIISIKSWFSHLTHLIISLRHANIPIAQNTEKKW